MFPYSKRNTVYNYLEATQEEIPQDTNVFLLLPHLFLSDSSTKPKKNPRPQHYAPISSLALFVVILNTASGCRTGSSTCLGIMALTTRSSLLLQPPLSSSFNHQPYLTLVTPHHSLFPDPPLEVDFSAFVFFSSILTRRTKRTPTPTPLKRSTSCYNSSAGRFPPSLSPSHPNFHPLDSSVFTIGQQQSQRPAFCSQSSQ